MTNIITHGIKEAMPKDSQRRKEDMKKAQQIIKEGSGVELIQEDITRVVHLRKYSKTGSKPLLMSIRTKD